jgi:hypothetical protein
MKFTHGSRQKAERAHEWIGPGLTRLRRVVNADDRGTDRLGRGNVRERARIDADRLARRNTVAQEASRGADRVVCALGQKERPRDVHERRRIRGHVDVVERVGGPAEGDGACRARRVVIEPQVRGRFERLRGSGSGEGDGQQEELGSSHDHDLCQLRRPTRIRVS